MARVKLGLRNLSVSETIMKGNIILHRMQGNEHLPPDPVPSLQEIQNKLNELKAAALASMTGERSMLFLRNERKKEFIVLLRRLGGWIGSQTTAGSVIASTGFEAVSRKGSAPDIRVPKAKRVFNLRSQIFKILWQPVPGAKQYIVELSQNPYADNAQWMIAGYTSKAKYVPDYKPNDSMTFNYYRVKAIGTRGISQPSNIVKAAIL